MLTDRERQRLKTFYSTKALVQRIRQGSGGPAPPPPLFLGQSEDRKSHNNHFSRMFPSLILEC